MASASTSKEYKLAIKIAGAVSSSFDSAIGEAGQKISNLGSIAQAAAATAAAAWGALKLGEFISDAVDTYQGFEQAMANTSAIAGATGEQYDALRQAALDMGKATSKTASECADALGYMSLAGWDVNTSIASLEPVLRLSEATGLDLARCSDLVTDSMSALGIEAKDLSGYLDVVAMANNKSNQTAEMLMEAYIAVGGTMKGLKVPFQDTATALGVMANRGIEGSEAGTALNAVMNNLTTGTGQAGKMMAKLGISAFDSSGNFVGLEEVIRKVYDATKDMTEEQRNAALAAIGGKQHIDALNALMGGLTTTTADGAIEWNALSDALYNSDGAMAKMAETVTNTWTGAKARLDAAIDDLKINLVGTFAPYATSAINSVAAAIPNITAAIIPAAQGFVDYAIPKLTAFKDRAVQTFNDIRPTLERIGAAGQAAFTFLADAAGTAMRGIGEVISSHSGLFDKLGQIAQNVGGIIADIGERLKPVITWAASTALPQVADAVLTVVEKLADLALLISENKALVIALVAAFAGFQGIKGFTSLLTNLDNATKQFERFERVTRGTSLAASAASGKLSPLSVAFGVLTGKIKLADVAQEAYKAKMASLSGGFKTLGTIGKNAFTGLKSGISSIGSTLAGLGSKIMAFVAANPAVLIIAAIAAVIAIVVTLYNKCEWFREKVDAIIEAVKGYLSAFWEKAKEVFQKVWGIVQEVWGQIQPYLAAAWQAIISAVSAVVTFFQTNVLPGIKAVWSSICGVFAAAWELIKAVWEKVKPFFLAVWEAIKSIFEIAAPIIGGFFKVAWAVVQAVWSVAAAWFKLVWEGIKAVFSVVGAVLGGFFTTAWEYIKAVWNTVTAYFQAIFDTIAGIFSVVAAVLSGDFSGAWEAIKGIVGTWAAFFGTVWEGIKAVFGAVVSWFGGVFSAAWEAIKAVFAPVGAFFQSLWDTIVALFTSIGTAVGDAISGAVKGAINAVLKGAIGIINGFISAINLAIGVINAIPGVSIEKIQKLEVPQLAKGGIVTAPTLLEAGEAGNEAIIPLGELWGNMQDMIATNLSGATDGIAALAEKFEAADIGGNTAPISDLLAKLDNLGNGDEDDPDGNGEPPLQIIYSPTNHYHFEGEAPSKEDIAGAESMSQEEFNRRMDQYLKDRQRKNFRG